MRVLRQMLELVIVLQVSFGSSLAFAQLSPVERWEKNIQQFETLDQNEEYAEDSILFVGSSSIRIWDTMAQDMSPYPVIQRGFGGSRLSDVDWYAERIIFPHKFRALVFFVGNDISGTAEDKTPDEVAQTFGSIVRKVRKKYSSVPVFFIEITPTESRWNVWPRIREANQLIKQYCDQQEQVYFISTADRFLNASGKPRSELFKEDRLHLNRKGYDLWTEIIRRELSQVLE